MKSVALSTSVRKATEGVLSIAAQHMVEDAGNMSIDGQLK